MKKIRKQVWLAASAAVIAGNLYLIFKDNSKAGRTEWLSDWDHAATGDIVESFSSEGVITPSDEYPIYFDARIGPLEQVLVEEGDHIEPGTDLFQYSSSEIDEKLNDLTAEKEQIEQQISLIDTQLSEVSLLLSEAEAQESDSQTLIDSGDTTAIPSFSASTAIKSEILQQETENQKLQEEVVKYEKLIALQEEKKASLIVKSINEGYVKRIDRDLDNPVLVISSTIPAVQGVFDEKQVQKAEAGQRVEVSVDTTPDQFEGSLSSVSQYPEKEPSVKRESLYPFSAQLSGIESADLYPGLKAHVKVVTQEAPQVVAIPGTAILKTNKKTWAVILSKHGSLERRAIKTGLTVDGIFEVKNGVKSGEAIVINPHELLQKSGPFITPIKTDDLKKKTFNELSRTEKIKYVLMGVLS